MKFSFFYLFSSDPLAENQLRISIIEMLNHKLDRIENLILMMMIIMMLVQFLANLSNVSHKYFVET